MDLETLLSYEWGIMTPEFIIIGVATLLSLLDLFLGKKWDRRPFAWIGIAGILLALVVVFDQLDHPGASILFDTYVLDSFSKAFKIIFLVGTAFVLLLSMNYEPKEGLAYRGEFYYLLLTALLGAMMMASSADMITLFVGLELLSISSYILAGMRKQNLKSNEAAMKYVINGGISTAFILFGMSYVYGFTGSSNLYEVSAELQSLVSGNFQFIVALAFLMIFVGLSFKIATVPFYMWAPDVYEGSPTPVTAFLSVVSKAAGFVIIVRFFIISFYQTPGISENDITMLGTMQDFIAVLAGITMIVGNTIALRQKNIKRLLAYSSIAHAGYLLVPFVALSAFMFEALWFYLVAYLLMNLGTFALIQVITARNDSEEIKGFAGLYHRSPWVAVMLSVFLLSLAGIPGTAGFIGKLTIFLGALSSTPGHYVLVSVMMATTVISYFYYFGIMKEMFFGQAQHEEKVKLPSGVAIVVGLCVFGTILFGIMPNLALDFFYNNLNLVDFFG